MAARLVDAGCYACLKDAFGIYEAVLAGPAPAVRTAARAFTTALLLALREKELGLEATPWIERATRLSSTLDEHRYVEMVSAVPWASVGPAADFEAAQRPRADAIQEWLITLRLPASTSVLDRHLLLALTCNARGLGLPTDLATFNADRPLLQYRLGLCGAGQRRHLDSAIAAEPRFVEALFVAGRYEVAGALGGREWVPRALPLLTAAHEGLPDAPIVTVTLAGVWRVRNELGRALTLYDEALTVRPAQRDALLGRVITLTSLGRSEAAVATATRMVELGTWYMGDAYYWRAWNRYQTRQLDAAAADVADSRRFGSSVELLTLSGMVAYDQQRKADARRDMEQAHRNDPGNCTAAWFLGLINADEALWVPASTMFASAASCYRDTADALQTEAAALPGDLSAEALTQQTADYDRRIAESFRQRASAAFNAALASVRLGDKPQAIEFAHIAASHDAMKDRAETLLQSLEPK